MPALQAGGGAAQHDGTALQLRPLDGQVSGVDAGVFLGLVGALLFLVHHHQPDVAQGGHHRVPHPHEEVRPVEQQARHIAVLLSGVEPSMAHGHPAREAGLQALQQAGGEADLRHQPEHPLACSQHPVRQGQVDLGLARARDALQEVHGEGVEGHGVQRHLLLVVEGHRAVRACFTALGQQVHPLQSLHLAPLLQGGQHRDAHTRRFQQVCFHEGATRLFQGQQQAGLGRGHPGWMGGAREPHLRGATPAQGGAVQQGRQDGGIPVPGLAQRLQHVPAAPVPVEGEGLAVLVRLPVGEQGLGQTQGQQVGLEAAVVAGSEGLQLQQLRRQQWEGIQHQLQGPQLGGGWVGIRSHGEAQGQAVAHLHPYPHAHRQALGRQVGEGRQGTVQLHPRGDKLH